MKEGCRRGKDCTYPHHQPSAAAATKEKEGASGDGKAAADRNKGTEGRTRGRSPGKQGRRARSPTPATVCIPRMVCCAGPKKVSFGDVEVWYTKMEKGATLNRLVKKPHNKEYRHRTRVHELNKGLAVEIAIDDALELVEELRDDEETVTGQPSPMVHQQAVLPVQGRHRFAERFDER